MNLTGFQPIHESNLKPGQVVYFKNRWGQGFVLIGESDINGLSVELQKDAGFTPPLKRYRAGDVMVIAPGEGTFYEVKA